MEQNKNPLQVTRAYSPSVKEFNELYGNANKPVLITGIVSKWKATSFWNSQYFRSLAGNRLIPVKHMKNGNYLGAKTERMTLSEYLDKVNIYPINDERFYLSEQSTQKIMPEVISDYVPPAYINTSKFAAVFYIGSHVYSQIHFHPYSKALLCVVSGRKKVKIFPPDQTPFLYQKFNFSKITSESVDLNTYPLYKNAQYYECEVKAGEMLFFPIYWWHGVETEEFTSAVVFFWDEPRKIRWIPPTGISWYYPLLFEVALWVFKGKNFLDKALHRGY